MNALQRQLEALGLSDKESAVYIAALSLGASPVQLIAKQAGLKRATTYLVIADLTSKGLMSSVEKGKRTYYVAEDPANLARIIELNEHRISDQKAGLSALLPHLNALFHSAGERPTVRFYEGLEGVQTIRRDFVDPKYTEICSFSNMDSIFKLFPNQNKLTSERIKRKIRSKLIYTSASGPIPEANDPSSHREARFVPLTKYPFNGDITVYGDKVVMSSFYNKPISVLIENKDFAELMKAYFELAWVGAGK